MKLTRWPLLAVVAGVVALVGCGSDAEKQPAAAASKEGGKLVFVSPGGTYAAAMNAAFLEPFQDETGIKIEQVEGGDDPIAQVKAQVKSGNVQWDVAGCGKITASAFPDLWETIDKSIVTATDDFVTDGLVTDLVVASDVEAFPIIAYSTEKFKSAGPGSWADFFDTKKFPGPRGVPNVGLDSAWSVPAAALLADGIAPDQLVPFDLDRAYKKLDQLKPDIRAFYTTFSQSQDILRSGEVVINMMTDGRALQLVNGGTPVAVTFNQGFQFTSAFCVVKGSPNAKNGMRLLNYMLSHPEKQAVFSSLTAYGPTTNKGVEAAKKLGLKEFSSLHSDELIHDTPEFLQYIQDNQDMLLKRWNAWVGG
jgi:mannopine transport system substrate-binding protein